MTDSAFKSPALRSAAIRCWRPVRLVDVAMAWKRGARRGREGNPLSRSTMRPAASSISICAAARPTSSPACCSRNRRAASGRRCGASLPASSEPENAPRGRGRPKLGVVAREVTLLPRHWEWVSAQPGGASVTLRRLVDEARRSGGEKQLSGSAGNRLQGHVGARRQPPRFEEAIRALFADDRTASRSVSRRGRMAYATMQGAWLLGPTIPRVMKRPRHRRAGTNEPRRRKRNRMTNKNKKFNDFPREKLARESS